MMKSHPLHERAINLVREYVRVEAELISLLQLIEKEKIFSGLGYASMFQYAVSGLGLTESQAYMFIGVSRKCVEVPELQRAIQQGEVKASHAKRIVTVINADNSSLWIEKAKSLNQKAFEREVSLTINPERKNQFKCEVNGDLERKLERCRQLLNQKSAKFSSWEEVLEALSEQYLKSHDPVAKAERNANKQLVLRQVGVRHQVNVRDRGQCQHVLPNGHKCGASFWIDIHHKTPRSEGGKDTLNNLVTLCSSHHRVLHATG